MTVTGHGIDTALITKMVDVSREFFETSGTVGPTLTYPDSIRDAHAANKFRGYIGGYSSDASAGFGEDTPPDRLRAFQVSWYEDEAAFSSAGYDPSFTHGYAANIWPQAPADFRPIWREYFAAVRQLGDFLLETAALALDLPAGWFARKFAKQNSVMLTNYYPARDDTTPENSQRLHPHTDYGAFTILYQEHDVGGLEVELRDGRWVHVPFVPDSFVVNLGDLLAKWTNNRWLATPHRVVEPDVTSRGMDRVSIPYFQHPDLDTLIETIPTCLKPGEAPLHDPVLWRDWGTKRVDELSHL